MASLRNEPHGDWDNSKPSTTYVNMHHNGDYSGDVIINVGTLEDGKDPHSIKFKEIEVPFQALKELVAAYVQSKQIERFENMNEDELLKYLND